MARSSMLGLAGLLIGIFVLALLFQAGGGDLRASASSSIPFVSYRELLPVETRLICTPLTQQQFDDHDIIGWDSWGSVKHNSRSYWLGGDVMVEMNGIPGYQSGELVRNLVAYTSATDAEEAFDPADRGWTNECFDDLVTKAGPSGRATELLPVISAFETGGAFPTGFVPPVSGDEWIYFLYDSATFQGSNYDIQGVGLAKMCADLAGCTIGPTPYNHFDSVRLPGSGSTCDTAANCLFWLKSDCNATVTSASAIRYTTGGVEYAYVFIEFRPPSGTGQRGPALARVPIAQIETKNAYEYYDESTGTWEGDLCDIDPLWSQEPFQSNSAGVSWNPFIGKYLAIYTQHAPLTNLIAGRTADQPEGPWSPETVILDCSRYLIESEPAFPTTDASAVLASSGAL